MFSKQKIQAYLRFVQHDIWRMSLDDLPKRKYYLLKQLRVLLLAIRGFNEDKCMLQASALTFYSMLSIVPLIAMAFGIAKGFGFEKMMDEQLLEMFGHQEAVLSQVSAYAHAALDNTQGGLVAGIGIVILLWTVMKVLGNIESSFNDIWEVKKARSWPRKFTDYLSIMLIAPILLSLSSSITVFMTTNITEFVESLRYLGFLAPIIAALFSLSKFVLIWILLTFLYLVMPNTTVKFKSALIAGILAGTLYSITEWIFVSFEVGVARYNAIYGSFAVVPLFLVFMQTAWLIVLFGAELAFAQQHVNRYEFEIESASISINYKNLLTLWVLHMLIKNFENGERPPTLAEISKNLKVPMRLLRQIVFDLEAAGLISEIKTKKEKEMAYQPARDIHKLDISTILNDLNNYGVGELPVHKDKAYKNLENAMEAFKRQVSLSLGNKLLKDI